VQLDAHATGDGLLGAQDVGVEVSTVTGEPFALVHEPRVLLGNRGLEARRLAIEHQILERPVRRMQNDRRRCFVDLA